MTNYPPPIQDPNGAPAPWPPAAVPPPRSGNRTLKIIAVVVGVILALCAGGTIALAVIGADAKNGAQQVQDDANRRAAELQQTPTTAPTTTPPTTTPATTTPAAPPTKTKPAPPPPVEVTDGLYTVGEDIPAGRYKVTEKAGEMCYWARLDSEGGLKDNHLGPGYPQFTARKGEQIEINNCPPYRKVK